MTKRRQPHERRHRLTIIEREQAENRRLRALIQQQECEHAAQEAALQAAWVKAEV